MLNLNIVILAAGMGKRMRSSVPKVMHSLAGRTLLMHVLNTARTLLPQKICIVIGHGGAMVKQSVNGDDLIWVAQDQQLGTGHALMQAQPYLDKDGITLVLYGDVPLISVKTLQKLIDQSEGRYCAVLTAMLDDPSGYGRILRDQATGNITAIIEQRDADIEQHAIREINTGVMLMPNIFLHKWLPELDNNNDQNEYYLTDIIAIAVKEGRRVVSTHPEHTWEVMGVNTRQQLAELERIHQQKCAEILLDQGVCLADPARIDIRGDVRCGVDVVIDINCIFEGNVWLGDSVQIGAHCILRDVTVETDTVIQPYSLLENSAVGKNCRIGPYARIRPGTRLADGVHVGNFVEVKNSQIASGSKANHLSYIGDAIIGERVNIGAGTITCNYDGANKYQTVIEDDVFIGSDTQLVAPIRIARKSTIGAGSTITRNTPEDALTVTRVKQISYAGWKRPVKIKK